jgi:hypothetical protein
VPHIFKRARIWRPCSPFKVRNVNVTVKTIHENESIYIPIGAVHRLENPGKILLELIGSRPGAISVRTTLSVSKTIIAGLDLA